MAYVGLILTIIGAVLCLAAGYGMLRTNIAYKGDSWVEWVMAIAFVIVGCGLSWAAWHYAPFRAVLTIGGACG